MLSFRPEQVLRQLSDNTYITIKMWIRETEAQVYKVHFRSGKKRTEDTVTFRVSRSIITSKVPRANTHVEWKCAHADEVFLKRPRELRPVYLRPRILCRSLPPIQRTR